MLPSRLENCSKALELNQDVPLKFIWATSVTVLPLGSNLIKVEVGSKTLRHNRVAGIHTGCYDIFLLYAWGEESTPNK
ncbi:unnamed protein product [Lathyrus sativus]|nr:unnamed protein product [Lathyrus sativus]